MIPDIARRLAPYEARVADAQTALDTANRATTDPLGSLAPAGYLIHALHNLCAAQADLLGAIGTADDPDTTLTIHGRLRTLHEQDHP